MKRRAFIIVAGCASTLPPLAARAQSVPVVGYLGLTTAG
jgi:phosphoribosylcarboxyaminoimidazole (NCAIR) mutase